VFAQCDAMERRRAGPQLVQLDPHKPQGVRVYDVEAAASAISTLENRELPMTGSTTSGYWPGLGMRFG
jgi:hypothetical protein